MSRSLADWLLSSREERVVLKWDRGRRNVSNDA
jgi:hypothetical protein